MKTISGLLLPCILTVLAILGCKEGGGGGGSTGGTSGLTPDPGFACEVRSCSGTDCCKESACKQICEDAGINDCGKLPKDFVNAQFKKGIEFLKDHGDSSLEKEGYEHLCSGLNSLSAQAWTAHVTNANEAKAFLTWFVDEEEGHAVSLFKALNKKDTNKQIFRKLFETLRSGGATDRDLINNLNAEDISPGKKFFELLADDTDKLALMRDLFITDWSENTSLQPEYNGSSEGASPYLKEAFILDFFCKAAGDSERRKIADSGLFNSVERLIDAASDQNHGLGQSSTSKREEWPPAICTAVTTVYDSQLD